MAGQDLIGNEVASASAARLPALGAPEVSVEYIAKIKEIIETQLGRRGSQWDRAVTFRDLQAGGLGGFIPGMVGTAAIFNPGTGQITTDGGATFDIDAALRESSAYKDLMTRIGSVEELESLPEQISAQLREALIDVAHQRGNDIRTIESKFANEQKALAWRLEEITSSLNQAAAGAREYSATYADDLRAVATRVEQVAAELEAGGGGVEVQQQITAIADAVNGLKGQYSLKIQTNPVNGQPPVIAGIALSVEDPIAGPGTSALVFMAEKFGFYTNNGTKQLVTLEEDKIVFNGLVKARNLLVSGGGSCINDSPELDDMSAWLVSPGLVRVVDTFNTPGAACRNYITAPTYTGAPAQVYESARAYVIDPASTYRLSASLYAGAGNNRSMFIYIDFFDKDGVVITGTGWGGSRSGYVYGGAPPTNTFSRQGGQFGFKVAGRAIPFNARTARIGVWFQYTGDGAGSYTQSAQDLRLERATDASLIVDGDIEARHIKGDTLDVLAAFFGSVQLGAGGALWTGQTAYDTGVGLRLGTNAADDPYFSARSGNGNYVRFRPATNTFETSGMRLIAPVFDPLSVSIGGNNEFYGAASGKSILVGSIGASITGAYSSVQWLLSDMVGGTLSLQNATSQTVTVRSNIVTNPGNVYGILTCNVVGMDNRVATVSRPIHAEHL
jgi:hypothetical protein